jgi:hypothetical protein
MNRVLLTRLNNYLDSYNMIPLTNLKVSVTIFHTCENSYIFYLQLTRKRSVIGDGIMT